MTSVLRINHFIESANQAYQSPTPKQLCADAVTLGVRQVDVPSSVTPSTIESNKQSWKIFRESLVGTIGQRKYDWICHRYRKSANFTYLEKSGKPLLPEHVELFSIGASQLISRDIKTRFPEKIKAISREQLTGRMRQVQPFTLVGNYIDPLKITGAPSTTLANYVHDQKLMDKEKQLLFSDVEPLTFPAWQERMCKVIVNRELIVGQYIPAPGLDGRMDYYKVHRKIAAGGLVSYALKPAANNSTLKPLVLFRPSQWALSNEDTIETYLNDVQPNVGEMGWQACQSQFEQLMRDPHFRRADQKISIAGYSLGGAHAQYFLDAHAHNISHAVFYSDPSADDATAEHFAQMINSSPRRAEPLNIQIYRMKGDFCHYVGGKHVGWGVNHPDVNVQLMEVDHENKTVAAFRLHSHRIFDNATFPYQMQCVEDSERLNNMLDNSKRGPDVFWYERMRRVWGGVAFVSFQALAQLINLVSWIFGVRILRSSKDIDL